MALRVRTLEERIASLDQETARSERAASDNLGFVKKVELRLERFESIIWISLCSFVVIAAVVVAFTIKHLRSSIPLWVRDEMAANLTKD
jgi:hypothetical protein